MHLVRSVLLGLCLGSAAKADTFWLSDPKVALPPGALPRTVVGVLLQQSDEGYHVRVVGGEVLLPRRAVFQIDKDNLSLDDILQQERAAAERALVREQERQAERQAERQGQRAVPAVAPRTTSEPAEASSGQAPAAAPYAPLDPANLPQPRSGYDPVVRRHVSLPGEMTRTELRRELAFAWRTTRDPRYLEALRQLR